MLHVLTKSGAPKKVTVPWDVPESRIIVDIANKGSKMVIFSIKKKKKKRENIGLQQTMVGVGCVRPKIWKMEIPNLK